LFEIAEIGKDRLHLAWVSSAEAQRFVEVVTTVTESVKTQGKFDPKALSFELAAAEMTLSGEILRWMVGKEVKITTDGDVYGRKWDTKSFETILDAVLEREYQKNLIYQAVKEGYTSVRDIGEKIGLDLKRISYLLADLEKTNMVEFTGMKDRIPVFAVL
jgi:coenzyme F420-reducing hydrogenase alpha subunit